MSVNLDRVLFVVAYVGTFLMYLQVIPINIETQPVLPFLCLIFAVVLRFKKIVEIKNEELLLILFCFVVFCYLLYDLFCGDAEKSAIYCFRLTFCPLLYLFVLKNVEYVRFSYVKIVVYVLLSFCLAVIVYIPLLSDLVRFVIDLFLPRYSFGGGVRGVSILTTEPSYFVYFAILIICTADFLQVRDKSLVTRKEIVFIKVIVILMAVFTKSALVYLYIIFYITINLFFIRGHLAIKYIAVLLFSCVLVPFICFTDNRLMEIVNNMIASKNALDCIFYADASGGFRALFNCLYYLSIFIEPFGFGLGRLSEDWFVVASSFNINPFVNDHLSNVVENINNIDAQAYIPNVVGNVGIFSLLIVFFIFKGNKFGDFKFKFHITTVLILFVFLLQSNYVNPVFWILIAFLKYDQRIEIRKPLIY